MANSVKWTDEQFDAISASGGSLLVSAAAGSGKTAVLVNRVISKITNGVNPWDINKLLVVTFSNEAAKEMKERVSVALTSLIKEQPKNIHLKRQQVLLETADISTVHSFCLNLIKDNFHALDLQSDFSVADELEKDLMKQESITETIEEFFRNDSPENAIRSASFTKLSDLIGGIRNERSLAEVILKVYHFIMSTPFPDKWLVDMCNSYSLKSGENALEKTLWYKKLSAFAKSELEFCHDTLKFILDNGRGFESLEKAYLGVIEEDFNQICDCIKIAQNGDYQKMYEAVSNIEFARSPVVRKCEDKDTFEMFKELRSEAKKTAYSLKDLYLCCRDDCYKDINEQFEIVCVLADAVRDFKARYDAKKRDKNTIDFNDIEQFALRLLVDYDENNPLGYSKTNLAKIVSQRYDEILVDEYQDTNNAQDMIFKAVSKDETNIFMVGDAKQGIYRFRQASPEIFIEKKAKYTPFDRVKPIFPACINLDKNFRSRAQVTSCINMIFETIMSEKVGEITYDGRETLKPGASYDEAEGNCINFSLIETSETESESILCEAKYVTREIQKLIDTQFLVSDKGVMRPCKPRDFCILLRSVKDKSIVFLKELSKAGISAICDTGEGFFEAKEINVIISILQGINNPLLDVSLIATMMSPIFGFSSEDIAVIKLFEKAFYNEKKDRAFYNILTDFVDCKIKNQLANECKITYEELENLQNKCADFYNTLKRYRYLSATMTSDKLIGIILEETDFINIVCAMKNGENRKANLRLFISIAAKYEKSGYKGISGFVRLLSDLIEQKSNAAGANGVSDTLDSVRILSVHKSKGLEFPVCFVCDLTKRFNKMDLYDNIILHNKLGVGAKLADNALGARFATLPHNVLKIEKEREMLSEEMRILYVALTRAREKLYFVASDNNIMAKIDKLQGIRDLYSANISHFVANQLSNFAWICLALLAHPDLRAIKKGFVFGEKSNNFGFNIDTELIDADDIETGEHAEISEVEQPNFNMVARIKRQCEFRYLFEPFVSLPSKVSVSEITKDIAKYENTQKVVPDFIKEKTHENGNISVHKASASERGTAIHAVAQFVDFEKAKVNLDEEIARLINFKYITAYQGEIVDREGLKAFLNSEIAEEIVKADFVHKEMRIMYNGDIDEIYPNFDGLTDENGENILTKTDEKIVVQGVIDLLYKPFNGDGYVILDYKSDNVESEFELVERYKGQVLLYKKAIEKLLGERVLRCVLYSFKLGKVIEVE